MLNYCVIKDNNLLAQFRDERDANKFAKETGGKLAILGFREVNTDVEEPKKEVKSNKPVVDISKIDNKAINKPVPANKPQGEEKPKRKRRTKAEMQEARRLEALAKS